MMHNDLHSGNVMFDPETNSLTLIDYGEWRSTTDGKLHLIPSRTMYWSVNRTWNIAIGRHDALPPVQYAHAKSFPDQAMHKYRYVPDPWHLVCTYTIRS
jgi:hypothetical protein